MNIVAISGPSSSGKSTLTRCLKQVFRNSIILYQDDFYWDDDKIPVDKNGLQDWDCPEAFDLDYLRQVLTHVHKTGQVPESFMSKEEQNTLGPSNVSDEQIEKIRNELGDKADIPILFVDGIMLYHQDSQVFDSFDLRFFLRSPYAELKKRREARAGYVTLQDFWTDPPGYFDDIVWPQYVNTHSHLFNGNDIEAELIKPGIETPPTMDLNISQLLEWAVPRIHNIL